MKSLETLGESGGNRGPFRYRKDPEGVLIKDRNDADFLLTHDEWNRILAAIRATSFHGVTTAGEGGDSFQGYIQANVLLNGKSWSRGSRTSCVAAILEHEGSLELTGPAGGRPIGMKADF